jgi:vacuolar-type H+-ATPase subunit I/STV1
MADFVKFLRAHSHNFTYNSFLEAHLDSLPSMIQILTAIISILVLLLFSQYWRLSNPKNQTRALEQKIQSLSKAVQELEIKVINLNELSNGVEGENGSIGELWKEVERFIKETEDARMVDVDEKSHLFKSLDYLLGSHDYILKNMERHLMETMDPKDDQEGREEGMTA